MANEGKGQVGRIAQIIGPVVDVEFSDNYLPPIYQALRIVSEGFDVETPVDVIAEVQQHLGEGRVRAVSMLPTDGMVRGMKVIDTGDSITVPVGIPTLGRVMNVIGDSVDELGPVDSEQRDSIHRHAPTFDEQATELEMFETGIKVIDLDSAVQTRRKNRSVRRRGRWQNGFDSRSYYQHRHRTQRLFGICRSRRTNSRRQRFAARICRVGSYFLRTGISS